MRGTSGYLNYKELALDEIEKAHADRPALRVTVETTMENYHQVRFFRRGHHKELVDVRNPDGHDQVSD